jgi:hypothetical protein
MYEAQEINLDANLHKRDKVANIAHLTNTKEGCYRPQNKPDKNLHQLPIWLGLLIQMR